MVQIQWSKWSKWSKSKSKSKSLWILPNPNPYMQAACFTSCAVACGDLGKGGLECWQWSAGWWVQWRRLKLSNHCFMRSQGVGGEVLDGRFQGVRGQEWCYFYSATCRVALPFLSSKKRPACWEWSVGWWGQWRGLKLSKHCFKRSQGVGSGVLDGRFQGVQGQERCYCYSATCRVA
jgi:hypothetical protein